MRVLALDPGERVGWAAGEIHPETSTSHAQLHIQGHGMAYLKDAALQVHKAIVDEGRYDAVVYETYLLTAKGARVLVGSDLQPAQFIGMVRLCCWVAGIPCYGQAPKEMRTARMAMNNDLPGVDIVRDIVAKADAVSHDDGHFGSAVMHLFAHYFARYV